MDAKVEWQGRLKFHGSADSGFNVPLDSDPGVGGDNEGFRPLELMALSLAGCTAMDVISILTKKRQKLSDFQVNVHAERSDEHPRVFTSAVIEYQITGNDVKETAVLRAIELSALRYCPAQGMLSKVMPMELRYSIFEDTGEAEPSIITTGVYTVPDQNS